jgi:WD40 repeat protein
VNESALKQRCPECGLEFPVGMENSGCPGCCLRLALSPDALTPLEAKRPLPPGLKSRFFGDYEIIEEIARGGMGVVYRARQLGLNRLVALKMIQSHHLLSEEARLRFRVEIEAVAQLHHPHIVSLYESDECDGAHYFTMRLVEGGDLASQIKKNRPLRERVQLLVKVCRAVHYAHQRGILHRDLKPSNILVDQQGEPHVVDFGLAKSLDHDGGFTFTSSVLGSPNYMAPEQATGKTPQLTTAVDVYGLGAILYHMLAGRPPFQAKTPIETLRQVVDHDPAPPRSFNARADADLETIALKCLRKEPSERFGSAEELAQDLERWLAGEPILARPLGFWGNAWRWSRRHPAVAALGAALVVALATIVAGTGLAAVRIQRAERQSALSLRESLLRETASFRLGGELGHRNKALGLLREAAALGGPPEFRSRLRNELIAALARTDIAFVPASYSNAPSSPELIRLDERFERLATIEDATNILIRAVFNGTVVQRFISGDGPVVRVEGFSPNGRFLAMRHTNSLSIWELETGLRCLTHAGTNNAFAFAPHDDAVLLQNVPNEALLLELPSGHERLRWRSSPARSGYRITGWHTLSFSPDGQTVAGASGTSPSVELMNPDTGEQLRVLTNFTAAATPSHAVAMCWSRNGGALAVATMDGRIYNWNPRTGERRWVSPPMIAPARSITYHPRGDWVAAVCENDQMRYFDDLTQGFVFEHSASGEQIGFSPDGSRLGPLRTGEAWGWLELRPSREYTEFRVAERSFRLSAAGFSADGRILAVGHSDKVLLIDPERGTRWRERDDWRMSACIFHPSQDQLFVGGTDGLVRYRHSFSQAGRLTFSRGERIQAGSGWQAFDFSADGRFLAAFNTHSNSAFVFDQTFTNRLATVGPMTNVGAVAVSPDGRWLTTGANVERTVRLWDVTTGKLMRTTTVGPEPQGVFSTDGRWLAVMGGWGFHLFETGTWKDGPALPLPPGRPILGAAAFSPDSRVLALAVDRFTVQLIDLRHFKALGTLRPPGQTHIRDLAFSGDGSRLVAVGPEARVATWNLHHLQKRLIELRLAWDKD